MSAHTHRPAQPAGRIDPHRIRARRQPPDDAELRAALRRLALLAAVALLVALTTSAFAGIVVCVAGLGALAALAAARRPQA